MGLACASPSTAHTPSFAIRLAHLLPALRRWAPTYYQSGCSPVAVRAPNNSIKKRKNHPFCFVKIVRTAYGGPAGGVYTYNTTERNDYYTHPKLVVTCRFGGARVTFCVLRVLASADLIYHFVPLGGRVARRNRGLGRFGPFVQASAVCSGYYCECAESLKWRVRKPRRRVCCSTHSIQRSAFKRERVPAFPPDWSRGANFRTRV